MIKALLFDLDGTLLPMDSYAFAGHYMKLLVQAFIQTTGEAQTKRWIMEGVDNVLQNTTQTNREAFFQPLIKNTGISAEEYENKLLPFYTNTYPKLRDIYCKQPDDRAVQSVKTARRKGLKTVLATNPFFPRAAIDARIEWAGLTPADFDEITTYENYRAAKPRPEYFMQILETISLQPEECVLIGNDCSDDLPAGKLGIGTFWLTEWPLNYEEGQAFDHSGKYDDLLAWIEGI